MHDVTLKVVAMAVSTVITMFRILLQISLFIYFERLRVKGDGVRFSPQSTQSSTEFFLYYSLHFVIQSEAKNLGNTKHWKQVDVLEILPPLRSSG